MSRFELVLSQLLDKKYGDAIYHAYVLLHKYPNNKYLKYCVAYGLYYLTIVSNCIIY